MSETANAHERREREGFFEKYLQGKGLDVGYVGYVNAKPVAPNAIGVDLGFPGYDGKTLPFADQSQDFVYSSHCLEHIKDYKAAILEWFRVTKISGYLIITVPHKYIYEKKNEPPSHWNGEHHRFYTPSSLLKEIEESLVPNSYRVVYVKDCDDRFDYSRGPELHSSGEYQIECVLKRIEKPEWDLA